MIENHDFSIYENKSLKEIFLLLDEQDYSYFIARALVKIGLIPFNPFKGMNKDEEKVYYGTIGAQIT